MTGLAKPAGIGFGDTPAGCGPGLLRFVCRRDFCAAVIDAGAALAGRASWSDADLHVLAEVLRYEKTGMPANSGYVLNTF